MLNILIVVCILWYAAHRIVSVRGIQCFKYIPKPYIILPLPLTDSLHPPYNLPLATPYQTFPLPYPTHTALLRQRCGNASSQRPCLAFSDQAHPCKIPLYPWTCAQGHYLRYVHLLFRQPHGHLHQATQPYRLWAPSTPPRAQLALSCSAWGGVLECVDHAEVTMCSLGFTWPKIYSHPCASHFPSVTCVHTQS